MEKTLGNYEADIFRHLNAAEDVMAESSSKAVKCAVFLTTNPGLTLILSRSQLKTLLHPSPLS